MLNRFDQGLAEMFFGQYPILIEGDTEYAAFETVMNRLPERFPMRSRPLLVRARGKWTFPLIIKILRQFRVLFALLHDTDSPRRCDGKRSGAWKANFDIYQEVCAAREAGIRVVHRVSVPNFEYACLPVRGQDQSLIEMPEDGEAVANQTGSHRAC